MKEKTIVEKKYISKQNDVRTNLSLLDRPRLAVDDQSRLPIATRESGESTTSVHG